MPIKLRFTDIILLIAFLLSIFYIIPAYSQSQTYPFKKFPLPQDLPPIACTQQDYQGFIWIGTDEGLYRFDGIRYTYYEGKEANGLGREAITSIMEDEENNLWVGARTGLYKHMPQKKDFQKFAIGDELYPRYIHQETDTSFLVHTDKGIYLFYTHTEKWVKLDVGLPDNKLFAVTKGNKDDLWIGTENILRKFDIATKKHYDIQLPRPAFLRHDEKMDVNSLFLDSHEQLWINTWFKGVMKLNTRTGEIESFGKSEPNKENYLLGLFNPSIAEDHEGNIWLASWELGLNIYNQRTGNITHVLKGNDYASALTGNYFAIMSDNEKNMWVTSERGLHYLSRKSLIPTLISNPETEIPEALFVHFLKPDFAVIGTYFGLFGVNIHTGNVIDLSSTIQLPAMHNAEFQAIIDVLRDADDNLWFTTPKGIRKVQYELERDGDPKFTFKKFYATRPSFWASLIIPLRDSIVIVKGRSNTSSFATFNLISEVFDYHDFPDSISINQLIPYKNDTIILCIRNKELTYYHIGNRTLHPIPWKFRHDPITVQKPVYLRIKQLDEGKFGICTENYGLFLYYPKEKSFEHIDIQTVAKTNVVYSVDEDSLHNLWIQTSSHFLFYNNQTQSLSKINLPNSFKGYNPAYFIHNGKELYCTFEGALYHMELNKLLTKTEKPKLYLQTIKARDKALDLYNNKPIKLGYSDNFLNYEYIGIDYDNPGGISYWYNIPEISDQWIRLNNQSSISFGRLSPGNYNFSLKASNDAGLWSEEIHAPEIRITPPFWKTWWFILLLATVAASLIAYISRLARMKRESELRLRNQIARDLHDDIGSTLSGIKIFSTIASDMAGSNKDLSSLLNLIRDKSDIMMQSMSDIVWSINPAYDSLHDMTVRLKQYMSEMLESQNIEVAFSSHTDLKTHKIDLRHRKELYLALKEIINNAAKHSGSSKLIFDITKEKGEIVFFIKDNGRGMNESNIVFGNGLNNIESRIRQIDGKVKRESSSGNGTSYEIRVATT